MDKSRFDFTNTSALLDTNILIELMRAKKQPSRFREVFSFLEQHNCQPFVLRYITDFEFTGFSTNRQAFDTLTEYITQFEGFPPRPQDYENAAKLSAMYKCKNPSINPKQISFADCLYAASLLRFKDRACIVTTDLNDYPSFLFDMPKHFAIEESGGSTLFVGITTFNADKYAALQKDFDRSGASAGA